MNPQKPRLDLDTVRKKLAAAGGKSYWRSLDELAGTPEFDEMLHREFPRHASEWSNALDRRSFLKLMGASLALAGLSSCARMPEEKIVPFVRPPADEVPGKPLYFASAALHGGYAIGTLVRSDQGRPTKIEGNPQHPASLGATDIFAQASVLTMYDPDRSKTITSRGEIRPWSAFLDELVPALGAQAMVGGAGLRVLSGGITSPTMATMKRDLLSRYPRSSWHQYQPVNRDAVLEGSRIAFGEFVDTLYDFEKADIVVSFDADFLNRGPASVRYAHDFAARRRIFREKKDMNRLYAMEAMPTATGMMADHRLPVRMSEIPAYVGFVAQALGIEARSATTVRAGDRPWLEALVRDLKRHPGSSLLVAGEDQPGAVHAMVHAMNTALGNIGKTVMYTESAEIDPVLQTQSLRELTTDMAAGNVQLLLVLGGNPVFDAPADLGFAQAMRKVDLRVHVGLYDDETSALSHWHIPESHTLESWGDARAYDGTTTVIQPLIAPLYDSRSTYEVVDAFLGNSGRTNYDIIREYWRKHSTGSFEDFWTTSLNTGFVAGTASPRKAVFLSSQSVSSAFSALPEPLGMEVTFRPDPSIVDGSWINNGWLQELPRPFTKLTWDNAVLMSIGSAQKLGVTNSDVVRVSAGSRSVEGPVFVVPGHADASVTLHLGYGRTRTGKVGTGAGFDVYPLRVSTAMTCIGGAAVAATGRRYPLSVTQQHQAMEGRAPARVGSLEEYLTHPGFAAEESPAPPAEESLYPKYDYDEAAWGMTIDLNACTGCSACVVACQSENNIPIVGKEGVANNREMQWIRIDQYYDGDLENPQVLSQPVACHQCENAPCEIVCPVGATMHDSEGLNVMVYNRCVGTRYCSNNCPYKVRRFNFLEYNASNDPAVKMMHNPDVTVRSRGVMEKCTYCIQRISHARIDAKKEGRPIRDGEVVTACQAACPSQAIVFGNLNDRESAVHRWKEEPRGYGLLAELNTRPRTTFLARLKNPNPEIQEKVA
jgi:MoCo/4Fe-4S cofactor protein with predicted Tat translocation signal